MDEIDFALLKELAQNSRLTYSELAHKMNMSISAIYKRIKKLVDDEIIEAFVAQPNVETLHSLWVLTFGTSKAKSMDAVSKGLGQHESINNVGIFGGKFLYISGYLRNISELQEFSAYVSEIAQMSNPTVGIISMPYISMPESLSSIDYKIIKSLNRDARKPVIDIAEEVGLTAKTVRKRLERMIKYNLITFKIEWSMKAENNFNTMFHIHLNEGSNIDSISKYLYDKYNQNLNFVMSFSNIPNFLLVGVWTRTAQDSQKIQEQLQTEGFKDIVPHIFLSSRYYDTWIDQMLRTK